MNLIFRWCPSLVVEKYYGAAEERRSLRIKYVKTKLAGIDVLLTTYHTVTSTPEERKMFRITQMHYVVFDEAHMLKNMNTQRYANLYTIKSERRLLLTGTPLQNNLLELISLLCFVMPSLFASKSDDIKTLFQKNVSIKSPQCTLKLYVKFLSFFFRNKSKERTKLLHSNRIKLLRLNVL